jgi:translation initiation factor IF-2
MRVHELAKELGTTSKELLDKLHALGLEAKSHMSSVDETAIALLREETVPAPGPEAPAEEKPAAPAAPPEEPPPEKKEPEEAPPPAPEEAPPPAPEEPPEAPPEPAAPPAMTAAPAGKVISIRGPVVVREFAELLDIRPNELIAELMRMNILASITQRVEVPVAQQVAEKYGFTLRHEKRTEEHKLAIRKPTEEEPEEEDRPEDLMPRPPVVTFLGHVDHGKTSLLDKIRHASVVTGEHGGITQHIGAYTVDVSGRSITFLDTPGHEAFTSMRARGANLTDIAVLVIAADDGIMPQTREAMQHAKAAGVTLLVALNKMDLPGANADTVKQQLQAEGLAPEDWGGETICCPVSAQTGDGLDHLLEMILLQAEMLDLKANPTRRARGFVIEAQLEPGMGPTANLLVSAGTLQIGDTVLCDRYWGKVKALVNDHGVKVKSAGPGCPVKCLGLAGVPEAGAGFRVCANEKAAKQFAEQAEARHRGSELATPRKASLDDLFAQIRRSEHLELNAIIKADTQGSVEAIVHSLEQIRSDKVSLNIILSGTGNITVNDIMLASASNAVIMGFHVSQEPGVDAACRHEGVEVRLHHVIYELIDETRKAMAGLLTPEIKEIVRGHAEVKQVFPIGKHTRVAGSYVSDGRISSRFKVRVRRGEEVLHEGRVLSLRRFQDNVSEVNEHQECGIHLEKFGDFAEGDVLEFYETEEVEQTL